MPQLGLGMGLHRGSPLFSGLLNAYPGAAAAYSLRRLGAYSGPVVEVRRSSDSATQDFTASQVIDGTLTTFTGAGDGLVSTWYDQSGGTANNAAQATTTAQPKIVDAGSLVVGGLDFDGVDDCMSVTGAPVITADFSGTFSMFGVQTIATAELGYMYGNASAANGTSLYANSSPRYTLTNASNTAFDYITRAVGENLVSSVYDNGDAGILVNGAGSMVDMGTYNFAAGTSDFIIGNRNGGASGGTFLDGQVAELIVYNSSQASNRTAIETEIIANYGIS